MSSIVYQIGGLITGKIEFDLGTVAATVLLIGLVYLIPVRLHAKGKAVRT